MGYDTSHVTSVLSNEGLSEGSRVILIVPESRDARQENAIADLENYLNSLDIGVELSIFPVGKSFNEDLSSISDMLAGLKNPVVSLSGGPRDFLIPLTVAVLLQEELEKVKFRSDLNSQLKELDLPGISIELNVSEEKIVSSLMESPKDVDKLVKSTHLSESTVYRSLKTLEGKNMASKDSGKYKATSLAGVIL